MLGAKVGTEGFEPSASLVLSQSGLPVAYVPKSATHTGFEPVISTVTGWRPLQTGLMGRVVKVRVLGFEPRLIGWKPIVLGR